MIFKRNYFYKNNYYNIKKSLIFNQDILFKCYHFLLFIEYNRFFNKYVNSEDFRNKLINQMFNKNSTNYIKI